MATAIVIDGAFFIKRFRTIEPHNLYNAERAAECVFRWAMAYLSFKRQVDQIILIAGDADFVPAAKLARREGIDFILDPMWQGIPVGLMEHIDGLRSTCPKPNR